MRLKREYYLERPSGGLGKLYDLVGYYSTTPVSEIERMANEALREGTINERIYNVLRFRVPFTPNQRASSEEVGDMLKVKPQRIRALEKLVYWRLRRYINWQACIKEGQTIMDLDIEYLPWSETSGARRAIFLFKINFGKSPTVGKVLEYFSELNQSHQLPLFRFGPKTLESASGTFEKVGVQFPTIELHV